MGPARAWFVAIILILIGVATFGAAITTVSEERDTAQISSGDAPGLSASTTDAPRRPPGQSVTTVIPRPATGETTPTAPESTPFTFASPAQDPLLPTTLPERFFSSTTRPTTTTTTIPPPPTTTTIPGSDSEDTVCVALSEVYRASLLISQPLDPQNLRLSIPPYRASIVNFSNVLGASRSPDLASSKASIINMIATVTDILSGVPTVDQVGLAYRLMTDPTAPPPGGVAVLAIYEHAQASCPTLAAIIGQPPA